MSPTTKILASLAVAAVLSSPAGAQGVLTQKNVSLVLAQEIANAAIDQCRTMGYKPFFLFLLLKQRSLLAG